MVWEWVGPTGLEAPPTCSGGGGPGNPSTFDELASDFTAATALA